MLFMLYCILVRCVTSYYIILYYTILYYIILYHISMEYVVYIMLYFLWYAIILHYIILVGTCIYIHTHTVGDLLPQHKGLEAESVLGGVRVRQLRAAQALFRVYFHFIV